MITPEQCRMARAALAIGVRDLAELAGVSAMTVTRFENGHSAGYPETLDKLQAALESAGVIFVPGNGEGPGVRLKRTAAEIEAKIGKLEDHLASTEPSSKRSPGAAMERMEHERKKHVVAKLKSRRNPK